MIIFICFILTPSLSLPFQPLLTSPLKLQNFTTPNEPLMSACCVCVCRFGISFTYVIEGIDSKVISVCLINDYLLIADLHTFVYGRVNGHPFHSNVQRWNFFILLRQNYGLCIVTARVLDQSHFNCRIQIHLKCIKI